MKSNNVFGVIGIRALDANWNASFDKYPKSLPDGQIYGSDKALKYAIRNFWHMQGEKVLYRKSLKQGKDAQIGVMDINEKYESVFGVAPSMNGAEVIANLLTAIDCKQFGFTFAPQKAATCNMTGVVQIGIGRNINGDTDINSQTILSPFRNAKGKKENGEELSNSTLGDLITTDQANYCYPFCIIPKQLDCGYMGLDIAYEEEDYKKFLKAASVCANAQNSCSKMGCNNEYVIVVEAKDDSLFLNNLSQHIAYDSDNNRIDLASLMTYLNPYMSRIARAAVYYDSNLVAIDDYDGIEKHPLFELEEII